MGDLNADEIHKVGYNEGYEAGKRLATLWMDKAREEQATASRLQRDLKEARKLLRTAKAELVYFVGNDSPEYVKNATTLVAIRKFLKRTVRR